MKQVDSRVSATGKNNAWRALATLEINAFARFSHRGNIGK